MAHVTNTYYDEGAGFVFLENVGRGANGRADLVRSLRDNQIYVRKQLTTAFEVDREDYKRPQREIKKASQLRDFPGVVKILGWSIYADKARYDIPGAVATFEVTYWEYYNAGTFKSLMAESMSERVSIPSYWICSWLIQTIKTVLELHEEGYSHRDNHYGNWFLHRTIYGSTPDVVLGDFDDVTSRYSTRESKGTQRIFQREWKGLADVMTDLLSYSDQPSTGPLALLLADMRRYSRRYVGSDDPSVDKKMRKVLRQARDILPRLSQPSSEQLGLAQAYQPDPRTISDSYLSLHPWSTKVQRYAPIRNDPGFEIIKDKGWRSPFIRD